MTKEKREVKKEDLPILEYNPKTMSRGKRVKRGGKRSLVETGELDLQKLRKAYELTGTTRGAAALVGISHVTARRYLHTEGIDTSGPTRSKHTSQFVKWLDEHPGVQLPRSPRAIARMSGCTEASISCYLYRRRKSARDKAESLPDLRSLGIWLYDRRKEMVNTSQILEYDTDIDKYTFEVIIYATMLDGKQRAFRLSEKEIKKIQEKAK